MERQPNQLLRQQRLMRGWSQKRLADQLFQMGEDDVGGSGINADMVSKWERGEKQPRPYYQEKLCILFGVSADQLGFFTVKVSMNITSQPPREQGAGDSTMSKYDPMRRNMLAQMLGLAFVPAQELLTKQPSANSTALAQYEKIIETCWQLSSKSNLDAVEQLLPIALSAVSEAATQTSPQQRQAASLASQGYLLAYVIASQHEDFNVALAYTKQAKIYAEIAKDPNLEVSAIIRQGVTYLNRRSPFQTLEAYQRASLYADNISPLLRARLYAGLAEVQGKLGKEQDARRSIGLANESYGEVSSNDPTTLYAHFSESSLHLHEGLALIDLQKPKEALEALTRVDGLSPKMPISERSRVDLLNQQAMAAAQLRDLERFRIYLEHALTSARALGSELRASEAWDIFTHAQRIFGNDPQINTLLHIFQS